MMAGNCCVSSLMIGLYWQVLHATHILTEIVDTLLLAEENNNFSNTNIGMAFFSSL
jgi:hypothetical protein